MLEEKDNLAAPAEEFSQGKAPEMSGPELNRSQKAALAFLVFFALAIIFMWGAQFSRTINEPFAYQAPAASEACPGGNCVQPGEADLRLLDTDGDGLSDYDELQVYKTSPYLEDSDSDGFSDKNEILSDNDPNCPLGQDCYDALLSPDSAAIDSAPNLVPPVDTALAPDSAAVAPDLRLEDVFTEDMDAASLRQILLAAGLSAEALGQISDEELMRTYAEVLADKQASPVQQ